MPTEIVLSETVLYSSLCTDNVTFISDQIAMFACWLHAPAMHVMNCPRTERVVCLALMPVTGS